MINTNTRITHTHNGSPSSSLSDEWPFGGDETDDVRDLSRRCDARPSLWNCPLFVKSCVYQAVVSESGLTWHCHPAVLAWPGGPALFVCPAQRMTPCRGDGGVSATADLTPSPRLLLNATKLGT